MNVGELISLAKLRQDFPLSYRPPDRAISSKSWRSKPPKRSGSRRTSARCSCPSSSTRHRKSSECTVIPASPASSSRGGPTEYRAAKRPRSVSASKTSSPRRANSGTLPVIARRRHGGARRTASHALRCTAEPGKLARPGLLRSHPLVSPATPPGNADEARKSAPQRGREAHVPG